MELSDRAKLYNDSYPNYPPLVVSGRWLYGMWMIGNNYRSKRKFYGEYPPSFLERIMSMFPDCEEIVHLFSGSLDENTTGIRFDINPDLDPTPNIIGDAHRLSEYFEEDSVDLIIADPPYSEEDAAHYGTPLINRNKVVKECHKILKPGGFLVWLDQAYPMYRKNELHLVGTIGIIRSTNHRFRVCLIWERTNENEF